MNIKTLWTILLKILGIYIAFQGISVLPQFLTTIIGVFTGIEKPETIYLIGLLSGPLLFLGIILWLFVYKTNWLIDKLHLTKGFDEERIGLNISKSTILNISIIVIGGLIFVESVPDLCRQIFTFVQVKQLFIEDSNSNYIIFVFAKACVGYLLMTQSAWITQVILKQADTADNN